MTDLWATNLDDNGESLPSTPIVEQAKNLAKRTGNLVKAEVVTLQSNDEMLRFDFDLVVDKLDYRFTLFSFEHSVIGYPTRLIPHTKVAKELDCVRLPTSRGYVHAFQADDVSELMGFLSKILGSATTSTIVKTLVAQAKSFGTNG